MSQISFTIAKALKESDFPQPDPYSRQEWYSVSGNSFTILGFSQGSLAYVLIGQKTISVYSSEIKAGYFAPGIEHIIPLIGDNALIKFRKDETGQIFECNIDEGDGGERLLGYHETNPAEAAAMAWLKLNETPKS